jgi:hypothetical protein
MLRDTPFLICGRVKPVGWPNPNRGESDLSSPYPHMRTDERIPLFAGYPIGFPLPSCLRLGDGGWSRRCWFGQNAADARVARINMIPSKRCEPNLSRDLRAITSDGRIIGLRDGENAWQPKGDVSRLVTQQLGHCTTLCAEQVDEVPLSTPLRVRVLCGGFVVESDDRLYLPQNVLPIYLHTIDYTRV